ncbi:glycoprotein 3-alpha-L-fucosyltransferase A-like [Penaeus japonicus]|uniref:glycoprotein 3-alpha-L-fucosyltransferase A-like n=1 Tax=Penaeus japonicus TaxID=27405 RepID=UPI001C716B5A|nr:glycoprotein 3-alpha-L-fucosyltransferase A-like [Penaeus japonicus]
MVKRSLKFKVVAVCAVLVLPYFVAHLLLSGRNVKVIKAVSRNLDGVGRVERSKPMLLSDVHVNAAMGGRSTAAGSATSASFASAKHLHDQLSNDTRNGEPEVPLKKILFWNKIKKSSYYGFGAGREPFIRAGCRVNACTITRNRSLFTHDQLDAVVWHARSKDLSLPTERSPHTRFVFMMMEPPGHMHTPLWRLRNVFNWTLTYRHDADITMLIGRVLERKLKSTNPRPINYAAGKSKMAAWFVSNCNTDSSRSRLTQTLQQYISVEVFGKCGPFQCPRSHSADCYSLLERDYKFYLSFENSLCKDYVTEKFFKILLYNVVPVVYGKANYSIAAPPHSYINVLDFASVKDLAQYLLYLDGNDTAYNEYFWWKPYYDVLAVNPSKILAWCDLCERLHKDDVPKVYSDVHDWYTKQATCKKAKYQPLLKAFLNGESINTLNRSVFL